MTSLKIPYRAADKISLLRQAATQYDQLLQEKNTQYNQGLSAKLRAQADRLEQTSNTLSSLNQSLAPLKASEKTRLQQLDQLVRHFYAAHKRRLERDPQGPALQSLFELDGKTIQEARTKPGRLIEVAQRIVNNEALATSQGFAPSTNPSTSEIQNLLDRASENNQEIEALTRQLKERKNMRTRQNTISVTVIRELLSTLRVAFHAHPKATQRELMRTFGFQVSTTPTKDPDDTPSDTEKPDKTN